MSEPRPLGPIPGTRWHIERFATPGLWRYELREARGQQSLIGWLDVILDRERAGDRAVTDGGVILRLIWVAVPRRGVGIASRMLDAFLAAYADTPIRLRVEPVDGSSLGADALGRWYGRRGFAFEEERPGWRWLVAR